MTFQGVIHGNRIDLESAPGLPDGQTVTVDIRKSSPPEPLPATGPPWWFDHLDVDPAVKVGKFVVKNTRLLADSLLELLQAGSSDKELLQAYPELSADDVAAVREYGKLPIEMRRSFGAWADEADELDEYLAWNRQQRKVSRRRTDD